MKKEYSEYGKQLRLLLVALNMTQKELAELTGIDPAYLSKYSHASLTIRIHRPSKKQHSTIVATLEKLIEEKSSLYYTLDELKQMITNLDENYQTEKNLEKLTTLTEACGLLYRICASNPEAYQKIYREMKALERRL
jgi:transcriptional regulator with XRE-family HTH domain